jgi:hypothetical protein
MIKELVDTPRFWSRWLDSAGNGAEMHTVFKSEQNPLQVAHPTPYAKLLFSISHLDLIKK